MTEIQIFCLIFDGVGLGDGVFFKVFAFIPLVRCSPLFLGSHVKLEVSFA